MDATGSGADTPLAAVRQEIGMSHCHSRVIRPNYCLQPALKLKSAKHYYNILSALMIENTQPFGNHDLVVLESKQVHVRSLHCLRA